MHYLALAVLYMYFVTGKDDDEEEESNEPPPGPGDLVDTDGDGIPDTALVPPPENQFLPCPSSTVGSILGHQKGCRHTMHTVPCSNIIKLTLFDF